MKIKVSDTEYYFMELPNEISGDQLFGIIERLRVISGFFKKSVLGYATELNEELKEKKKYGSSITPEQSIKQSLIFRDEGKENFLKLVQVHYFGSREEKGKLLEKFGSTVLTRISNEIGKKNVSPWEVGLKKFRDAEHAKDPRFLEENKMDNYVYNNKIVDELLNL